ncbi:unnamed protein product [Paramecium sonneborni]|uniref:Transmembrane protein n=1 Tax=Paramecium sonneborni TaxID=65129 RepID=A0A8S1RGD2_9CILI|nr:unnamed protein product [Paramecium sonneborni]
MVLLLLEQENKYIDNQRIKVLLEMMITYDIKHLSIQLELHQMLSKIFLKVHIKLNNGLSNVPQLYLMKINQQAGLLLLVYLLYNHIVHQTNMMKLKLQLVMFPLNQILLIYLSIKLNKDLHFHLISFILQILHILCTLLLNVSNKILHLQLFMIDIGHMHVMQINQMNCSEDNLLNYILNHSQKIYEIPSKEGFLIYNFLLQQKEDNLIQKKSSKVCTSLLDIYYLYIYICFIIQIVLQINSFIYIYN